MKNWIALCLACCFFATSCPQEKSAQQIRIVDSASGKPVEGAILYFPEIRRAARSDIDGMIHLAALADLQQTARRGAVPARLYAKNYQPVTLSLKDLFADPLLKLQRDDALMNPLEAKMQFTKADTLRGSYGPYRSNNDLKHYDLRIKLDIPQKFLAGSNGITFTMLRDDNRIQIDLFENMNVDSILFEGKPVTYERLFNAVFVDFPRVLKSGETYRIDFHYSGHPTETGRFGGIAYKEDSLGHPWIYTACQGTGASLWWPNKDQQPDEADSMRMRVVIPSDLTDASNGRLMSVTDLADGTSEYDWKIHYPINNYSVSLNIGKYVHLRDSLDNLSIDYYVLPYHLLQAKRQFAQVKPMLEVYQRYFGPYAFPRDGFKLIEVPYSGMEHQSAVTYGNQFRNGYLGRDWTGVGVSLKFDFIIIHESGHEWFGNSITANDVSDAWIQEGWCTYAEVVYVEGIFGYADALAYVNGYAAKVRNEQPIIGPASVNQWPTSDQYFKGALFLHTLRHVFNDDEAWWKMIREYNEAFRYRNIYTTDVLNFMQRYTSVELEPLFRQYLYQAAIPVLQQKFADGKVAYRWRDAVEGFAMPLKIRSAAGESWIQPSEEWQEQALSAADRDSWKVAGELFYIKQDTTAQDN